MTNYLIQLLVWALHEGSHIKLSDFDFLKGLEHHIPQEYINRSEVFGWDKYEVMSKVKDLLNYVEDRRIDYFVFTNSPKVTKVTIIPYMTSTFILK